ncbi:MAG: hypothetical protein Q7S75_02725 [bacterium]|nr:hypothetical protein [bacterium]
MNTTIKKIIRLVMYGALLSTIGLFSLLISKNKGEYSITLNPLGDTLVAHADVPPSGDSGGGGDSGDSGDSASGDSGNGM